MGLIFVPFLNHCGGGGESSQDYDKNFFYKTKWLSVNKKGNSNSPYKIIQWASSSIYISLFSEGWGILWSNIFEICSLDELYVVKSHVNVVNVLESLQELA